MGQDVSRREFLRGASGAAAAGAGAAVASGSARAQQRPDFEGWLDGVDGGFRDARGQGEVTVEVGAQGNGGNYAFSPAGLWVDPGTTVVWEWTGEGGQHNVVAQEGADFRSGDPVEGAQQTFEHTFEGSGVVKYQCVPHASLGMKGAVAVGDDVPTAQPGGGEGGGTPTAVGYSRPYSEVVIGGVASAFLGVALAGTMYLTYLGYREDRTADGSGE